MVRTLDADMAALAAMFTDPTHTSVPGDHLHWSDPGTWEGGQVPGDGAQVLVPVGSHVHLDGDTARLRWLNVEGHLGAHGSANITLRVETLVSGHDGGVHFGSEAAPLTGNLRVLFLDSGPLDPVWDPQGLSRGFISQGHFEAVGAEVTPWVALKATAPAGAQGLLLTAAPAGWAPGQRLVIPGISPTAVDDDVVTIASVSGNSVVLAAPLKFAHPVIPGRTLPVANLSRRITFESESLVTARRGHVMVMHPHHLTLQNAAFRGLGRTDKALPVTDVPNLGNLRGRYACHLHQGGVLTADGAQDHTVEGCVVEDSPGWGFVNHSSRAEFVNCAAYSVKGAAFVGEAGDEVGAFWRCAAVRSGVGAPVSALDNSRGKADWGHNGHAFWVQGGGIAVEDCIAAGSKSAAYVFMGLPFQLPGQPATTFPTVNLNAPGFTTAATVKTDQVPPTFRRNVAFGGPQGLAIWAMGGNASQPSYVPRKGLYEDSYLEASSAAVVLGYPSHQHLLGLTCRNDLALLTWTGTGVSNTGVATCIEYEGLDIRGFQTGINAPTIGESRIAGCTIQAYTGIYLANNYQAQGRELTIEGNHFLDLPPAVAAKLPTMSRYTWPLGPLQGQKQMDVGFFFKAPSRDLYVAHAKPEQFFARPNQLDVPTDSVRLDGLRLYLPEEGPDWLHTLSLALPVEMRAKTTGQLYNEQGLALGGVLLPADAAPRARVRGLVSAFDRTILV